MGSGHDGYRSVIWVWYERSIRILKSYEGRQGLARVGKDYTKTITINYREPLQWKLHFRTSFRRNSCSYYTCVYICIDVYTLRCERSADSWTIYATIFNGYRGEAMLNLFSWFVHPVTLITSTSRVNLELVTIIIISITCTMFRVRFLFHSYDRSTDMRESHRRIRSIVFVLRSPHSGLRSRR